MTMFRIRGGLDHGGRVYGRRKRPGEGGRVGWVLNMAFYVKQARNIHGERKRNRVPAGYWTHIVLPDWRGDIRFWHTRSSFLACEW